LLDQKLDPLSRKTKGREIVYVSLAAALLWPGPQVAQAQLQVSCFQNLNYDTVAVCAGGGTLEVQPDGGVVTDGCILALGAPQQASCQIKKITSTTTGSLALKVTTNATNVTAGVNKMQVKSFNIDTDNGGPTVTYTAASITKKAFKVGVGADLVSTGGQVSGSYSGQLMFVVTYTP